MKKIFLSLFAICLACQLMAADATTPTEFSAQNLIIFQSTTTVKSGWFWKNSGSGTLYNTTTKGTSGSWKVSYYNNTQSFNKCIAFSTTGTNGATKWDNNWTKIVSNDIVKNSFSDADNNWFLKINGSSVSTNSAFTHLGATVVLSSDAIEPSQSVTITYSNLVGSLCHETNDKWNMFVRKDAEDLTRMPNTTENFTGFLTSHNKTFTPTEAGTYTLYIYLTDPYGLETVKYTKTLTVTDPAADPALTVVAGQHVASAGTSVDPAVLGTSYPLSATLDNGYQFAGWTASPAANATFGDASLAETTVTLQNGSATVTATASPITYSITYDVPAGATNPNTATSYTIESATITLQDASMTGKKFNGWFSEAEFTNKITEITQGSTDDKTLFASFSDLDLMYFINRPNWSGTIYSYNWGSSHEVAWPGSAMTKQNGKIWSGSSSYDYYSHYYNESYPNCIYNNNSSQTADLTAQANKYFLPASSTSGMNGTWVDVCALSYGKSDYGTLTLKSGSTTITPSAGDKVVSGNSITFTATPDDNCHIVGWFSDAEFTTPIPEIGTETTYNLTISAAASVYVQFAEDTDPSVTLALSANTIKVGESVTFTPTAYKTDGSETYTYYVNDEAIANATFTPETKGTYSCKVVMHYNDADYTSNVENLTVTGTCRLYYSNPDGWATVYAYLWQNSDGSNYNAQWPGLEITANTTVINNRTYYYYEFDETTGWDRVIFNNGNGTQTGDISFSAETNNNQYNNAKASETGSWQPLPEPIDPETPYTTVKVLCDYNDHVKIFFLNKSEDFMVKDAEEIGTSSEYLMNALGEQTIDEKTGFLYEVSFYGTSKMAIFVSSSHIGDNNKLTSQDVDLTKAAKVTYYYDLTGVTAGSPVTNIFTKIMVPLTQGYGTFCYPQAVQVSQAVPFWMQIEENMEEESGYELLMTAMEDNILPANTGALIYSKEKNAQAILTVVESSASYDDNDFLGTTERIAMPTNLSKGEKVYVLGNGKDGIAFYNYQPTSGYIPAYKAYFRLTPKEEPQGAPSRVKMTFRTEPASPTNLETTKSTIKNQQSKIIHNSQLIIIRDGKKFNAQGTRL